MDDEVELISDGDGLAVIGRPTAIERFLNSAGLVPLSQNLGLDKLAPLLRSASGASKLASEVAAQSARWVKLTPDSVKNIKKFGLVATQTPGVSHAMAGTRGAMKSWIQIETGPASLLTNPALLSGVAGVMGQLAMQREMNQIRDYLATIDTKLDDVIRAQNDAQVAPVIGAGLDIDSAMNLWEREGHVDDDTWSTVQARNNTISDAIGWALLRFDALAEKMESTTKVGALGKTATEVESGVRVLLAVVARCFELQDALDVLRLDRALDASPVVLDGRRRSLKIDRQKRRERVSQEIERLMARMDVAAGRANSNVLLHSPSHRAVVGSLNNVVIAVDEFHRPLGIESDRDPLEVTGWWDAARDRGQLKTAGAEAGRKSLKVIEGVGATVVALVGAAILVEKVREDLKKQR